MVLSQGNEKGKLEVCRGSVLRQERTELHRAGYLGQGGLSVCPCVYTHQLGYL